MREVSFRERVKNVIISEAKNYKSVYVDYEYLICSGAFNQKRYYIIDAKEDNYQHLTGVHSVISSQNFYNKAVDGTLAETDFDFIKRRQNEKSVKGSVRRKIKVLPNMMSIFNNHFFVQENFVKNRVVCTFATTDNSCTIGFKDVGNSIPISLINGNETDIDKVKPVEVVLRKTVGKDKFDEVVLGNNEMIEKYFEVIKEKISEELVERTKAYTRSKSV